MVSSAQNYVGREDKPATMAKVSRGWYIGTVQTTVWRVCLQYTEKVVSVFFWKFQICEPIGVLVESCPRRRIVGTRLYVFQGIKVKYHIL
jgi:hypothetical protein